MELIEPKAAKKNLLHVILEPLTAARDRLAALEEWTKEGVAQVIEEVARRYEINMGKLGQPIRVAVTGGPVSPPLDVTVWLIGQERVLQRLDKAIDFIRGRAAAND